MQTIHRVSFNRDEDVKHRFKNLGIKLKVGDILVVFEVTETDPNWPVIEAIIKEYDLLDFVRTEFTKGELEASDLLKMNPGWISGYPMPDMDFGYLQITYDLDWLLPQVWYWIQTESSLPNARRAQMGQTPCPDVELGLRRIFCASGGMGTGFP